jgi:hypothetical protein
MDTDAFAPLRLVGSQPLYTTHKNQRALFAA